MTKKHIPTWKDRVLAKMKTARSFSDLFTPMPAEKPQGAYVEIGEWSQANNEFLWEGQGTLLVAPDGRVFIALGVPPEQIPDGGD